MRTMVWLATLLIAFPYSWPASAQGIFGLASARPGDLPVAPDKGNTSDQRPRFQSYYHSWGSSSVRRSLTNPYWSFPLSRVTFNYLSPLSLATPEPVVIIPSPRRNRDENQDVERIPPPGRPEAEAPVVPEVSVPGTPASVFRPIRPEDRAWAQEAGLPEPARPVPPAPATMPEPGQARPPLLEPPPLPGPPATAAEPKTASAQQIESGKRAFEAHQYGRAERSFHRATEQVLEEPRAYFLLAQARFALGKYAEAVAAIHAGMRLQPDWPNARYRPRELYGTQPDDFSEQLKRLGNALTKNPDDPFLPFLYAHQLWFDNRKDEARVMFQRAKNLAPDPSFSERFLQAKPGSPADDVVVELLTPGPRF